MAKRRKPFSKPPADFVTEVIHIWQSLDPTNNVTAGANPDISACAPDFVRVWREADTREYVAMDGLLTLLEYALFAKDYGFFDKLISELGDDSLAFLQGSVSHVLDSDVFMKTQYLDVLLELLGLLQFRHRNTKPLLSMLLHSSHSLQSVYLRSSYKRAEERLYFFQKATTVNEVEEEGSEKRKRILQMATHPIFNDFHLPQQKTIILHDDEFPIYTIEKVMSELERMGYTIRSPKRAEDLVRSDFLKRAITGLREDVNEEEWLNALKMNFRFALQFARHSRNEDILWIQDMQFVLSGFMLQTLAPNLQTVLFVESAFLPSEESCEVESLRDILRAMVGFHKVAFQSNRDCEVFRGLLAHYLPSDQIVPGEAGEAFRVVTPTGHVTNVSSFSIGVCSSIARSSPSQPSSAQDGRNVFGFVFGFDAEVTAVRFLNRIIEHCQSPDNQEADVTCKFMFISPIPSELLAKIAYAQQEHPQARIEAQEYTDSASILEALSKCTAIFHSSLDFKIDLLVKNTLVQFSEIPVYLAVCTGLFQELKDNGMTVYHTLHDDMSNFSQLMTSTDLPNADLQGIAVVLRSNTLHNWFVRVTNFWQQTDLLPGRPVHSLEDFGDIMRRVRLLRLRISTSILKFEKIPQNSIESLENVARALESGMTDSYARDFRDAMDKNMQMNVKDEVLTLKKDIRFLQMYTRREPFSEFINYLAEPGVSLPCPSGFMEEIDSLVEWFDNLTTQGMQCFITDWDGTMKTYATSYDTCMQPAYSAIIIAAFVTRFTELSAVLTAGPLRNTGILDLTCVPDGYITCWGGSWGQEWLISGAHSVNTEGLNPDALDSLSQLADKLDKNIFSQDKFNQFRLVGSGFQRKVDRINIGIQTVLHGVDADVSRDFVSHCLQRAESVDPAGKYLAVHETDLDLEFVIKQEKTDTQFTKADGIDQCLKHMRVDMKSGNVLICGDTASDIPMVERALKLNEKGTYSIFVGAKDAVRVKVSELLPKERRFFASCPEIVHCAMAKCLMHPVVISEPDS